MGMSKIKVERTYRQVLNVDIVKDVLHIPRTLLHELFCFCL